MALYRVLRESFIGGSLRRPGAIVDMNPEYVLDRDRHLQAIPEEVSAPEEALLPEEEAHEEAISESREQSVSGEPETGAVSETPASDVQSVEVAG